ncbi:hypothetical protein VPH35_054862 [Triticum aestivum]
MEGPAAAAHGGGLGLVRPRRGCFGAAPASGVGHARRGACSQGEAPDLTGQVRQRPEVEVTITRSRCGTTKQATTNGCSSPPPSVRRTTWASLGISTT